MFLGSKARPVRRADNLTAVCEPIVYTMWDPYILQPYRPQRLLWGYLYLPFTFTVRI
jgi:hypothetical protein